MNEKSSPEGSSAEWLILNCPSCEREVKLRADVDLGGAACPYCSEFLADALPEGPADAGESDSAPEGDGDSVEEAWRRDEPARVKRRSQQPPTVEEPAWDRDPSEPAPDADDGDSTEFVEVDPDNPDAVRVRKVKRKRVVTRAEKISKVAVIAFAALVGIGGASLLVIAIVKGTGTATQDIQTVAELPAKIQELIDAAKSEGFIPTELTLDETRAARAIAEGFLKAKSWREKLPYVYKPDRVGGRMEEFYRRQGNDDSSLPVRELVLRDKIVERGRYVIKLAFETHPGDYKIVALRQTADDIKVHWEASVGYQEMSLAEFKEQRPTVPVAFRVKVQADGYYNHEFADSERYQCIIMIHPGDPDFRLYGYIARDNPLLQPLLTALVSESPSVVLSARFPPTSRADNQVEVVSLLEESWFD